MTHEADTMGMTNTQLIEHKLLYPSDYIFMPMSEINKPLPIEEWEINDSGVYYTPQQLADEMGSLLELVPRLNGRYFIMRYGFDEGQAEKLLNYLVTIGLTDIRRNQDGSVTIPCDLDYTAFNDTEVMIYPIYQSPCVPITIEEV